LDGDGEVHGLGCGETANADTWDVLGDIGTLEGSGVGSTGGGIDGGGERACTILVDLVEGHLDGSVISACGHAGDGTLAGGGLDCGLRGASWGLGSSAGRADGEGSAHNVLGVDLTSSDGGGAVGVSANEESDHLGWVDWAVGVAANSGRLAGADLVAADDGGIGLSTTCWSSAITWGSVND